MQLKHALFLSALLAVALLGACTEREGAANGSSSAPATSTSNADQQVATTSGETTSDEAAPAGQPTDESPADDTSAAGEITSAATPSLVGEWLALFGMHDDGVVEKGWLDGQYFEFNANGSGQLVKLTNGQPEAKLFISWRQQGQQLWLSFMAGDAVSSGLCRIAPLGIARDEEAGLLPLAIGRDEESGLLKGETDLSVAGDRQVTLEVTLGPDFLALRDNQRRVMIYGRLAPESPTTAVPVVPGKWLGQVDAQEDLPVEFTIADGVLTATYGSPAATFVGEYFEGYYLGQVTKGSDIAFAALRPVDDNHLDGVLYPSPFLQMIERYDFSRQVE